MFGSFDFPFSSPTHGSSSYIVENWAENILSHARQFTEPANCRPGVRFIRANVTLDQERMAYERLCSKRSSRSGYASLVSAKSNEIIGLLQSERNLQEVKEKLPSLDAAFENLVEAHRVYACEVCNADGITQCKLYLETEVKKFCVFRQRIFDWISMAENKLLALISLS